MDLSELPLMPSAEVPEAAPASAPWPRKVSSTSDWPVEEMLADCNCPSCQSTREPDLRGSWDMSDPTAGSAFDPATAFAAVTSTARISTSSLQIAHLPRWGSPVQESRRIRGRYSHPTSGLTGVVRWREPGTLGVWDNSTGGEEQWTFRQEDADGSLRGGADRLMQWYPTEV